MKYEQNTYNYKNINSRNINYSKSNNNPLLSSDDDDDDDTPVGSMQHIHLPYFENTITIRKIKFYLDEQIKEPKYYRQIINVMDSLGENDMVEIVVNTYGGAFDSAVAIINAMRSTEAQCQVRIEGMAASAGSLIALAADNLFVMPSATLMLHQGVFGSYGKQTNVVQHAVFEDQRVQDLARDVYKHFLTEEELNDLFTGKDFWMHYPEIVERLNKRHQILLAEEEKEKKDNPESKEDKKTLSIEQLEQESYRIDEEIERLLTEESVIKPKPKNKITKVKK